MKPPTPQSLGRPAPPRSATPASVLNAHKLVGGATRVVMLTHRINVPRPAVSFRGKSVSAVAMLVGGGLELPLPLYCVDDVSKALVDLRPEGAPANPCADLPPTSVPLSSGQVASAPDAPSRRVADRALCASWFLCDSNSLC